jgi:hypothetical protein
VCFVVQKYMWMEGVFLFYRSACGWKVCFCCTLVHVDGRCIFVVQKCMWMEGVFLLYRSTCGWKVCFCCTEADGLLTALSKGDYLLSMCFSGVKP